MGNFEEIGMSLKNSSLVSKILELPPPKNGSLDRTLRTGPMTLSTGVQHSQLRCNFFEAGLERQFQPNPITQRGFII